MRSYFKHRLLFAIPTLLGVTVFCFCLIQLTPGGPVEQILAEWRGGGAGEVGGGGRSVEVTEAQRQMLIRYYGFDKPLPVRYGLWLSKVVQGDLGESYFHNRPVWDLLKEALPVSFLMGFFSLILTYCICIPLGVAKAVSHGSVFDRFSSVFLSLLYAMPGFALAVVLLVLFGGGSFWNVFPLEGMISSDYADLTFLAKVGDVLYHLFLPLVCYTVGGFASTTLLMKNAVLAECQENYLKTAEAKGLTRYKAIIRHAVPNALIPIASSLGQWIGGFFAGSLLIETVFNLQGVGRLSFNAILHRDYPVVLAVILLLSISHIVGNLVSDFLYSRLDPRVDFT